MTARSRTELEQDGETPETIRSALDALDQLKPPSAKWAADILANRNELLQELRTIETQGNLF
jgi:hypothetical protein